MEVLEIIREIQREKLEAKKYPTDSLVSEVILRNPEAMEELNKLEQSAVIKIGHTLNDRYIKII